MKIVCILQIYNELETGHLVEFFQYNNNLFDEIIIFDDGSTDGSAEYCLQYTKHVIKQRKNSFKTELLHKNIMLEKATELNADYIVSLDADEILKLTKDELQRKCVEFDSLGFDGVSVDLINLWRSRNYKRTDSLFDDLFPVKIWKHRNDLPHFDTLSEGLHQKLYPGYVNKIHDDYGIKLIHTGFCTEKLIIRKYLRYKSHGQKGFNLSRFIDDSKLKLEKVPASDLPYNWANEDGAPKPQSTYHYIKRSIIDREEIIRPKVSVICLIYQDVNWLDFVYKQVLMHTDLNEIEFFFVANQPTSEVKKHLKESYIPHYIFEPELEQKDEYYINNVYRAYNYGVKKAKGNFVALINSDMAFTEGWLDNLILQYDGNNCVSSRLVESGRLRTGRYGIEKNFGESYSEYREGEFHQYADSTKQSIVKGGGLYMPILINKEHFDKVGGYPAGNITIDSDIFSPTIANVGEPLISGDTAFISKMNHFGYKHITAFDSIIYHFQEGEKRSGNQNNSNSTNSKILICNDKLKGVMGEKVLWNFLLELDNTIGLDFKKVGGHKSFSFVDYISKNNVKPSVILQNVSFMDHIEASCLKIGFLQDDLRLMNLNSYQQEVNLKKADMLVTNSYYTASSYPEFNFTIVPVGVDSDLFNIMDKSKVRKEMNIPNYKEIGIFVGALDDVKGWPDILRVLNERPEMYLILISKYKVEFEHERVSLFCGVDQKTLAKALNCADFFILGSQIETQCLAAIEAALCNLPIRMKRTGIYVDISDDDLSEIGLFTGDFSNSVSQVYEKNFNPRTVIMKYPITVQQSMDAWRRVFTLAKFENDKRQFRQGEKLQFHPNFWQNSCSKIEYIYRRVILNRIIGRDNFYTIPEISIYMKRNTPEFLFKILRYIWQLKLKLKINRK